MPITVQPHVVLLACLPLIGYLLVLSLIRLSRHALVTTGGRDLAALAFGISGFIVAGPMELFFPRAAATVFGAKVWIALAVFYILCVILIALTTSPRLVIYGRTSMEVYEPLLAAAQSIDPNATGDPSRLQIELPSENLRLRIDGSKSVDHAEVLAFEPMIKPTFWHQLLGRLRHEMAGTSIDRPRQGWAMLATAAALVGFSMWFGFHDQKAIVAGFRDWFWR